MTKQFPLDFGLKELMISLPQERLVEVIEGQETEAIKDVPAAVREALNYPSDSLALREVVGPGDKVVIIASDITRQWVRHDLFLPALLDELNAAGVADYNITLVTALGAHRYHTMEDNKLTYGHEVVSRISIIQSCALDNADFVHIGRTSRGTEVHINRHVVNADKVILTGGIAYHSMAGFGGGRKAIIPGVAGYDTIQANHRLCLSPEQGHGPHPECCQGNLTTNGMHLDMLEIAAMVNPAFLLNAVFTAEGDFAAFVAGHWYEAWLLGCRKAEEIAGVLVTEAADVVIASAGGYPKDINFYQASKAIENACLAVKAGGMLIVAMECPEISEPPDFSQWFDYPTLDAREAALRKAFTVPGFVALKLGFIAKTTPVIVVSRPDNQRFLEKAGMLFAISLEAALKLAAEKLGRQDFLVSIMPHGGSVVPCKSPASEDYVHNNTRNKDKTNIM
ncbi:nickel-dependent lactate racemase [Sporomusa malonica]|uniref:Nickel-dependent lactate racemase n=1 Tax=Sporomusa malonica TaxID=112901 RepID=A0A1W2ELM3_9FIRM|nr:nickel-dependent lactate racemase [Sporomusa malonica]SMD10641.1 Nickel-dependent lactate racemase [Sporomusa malonica]